MAIEDKAFATLIDLLLMMYSLRALFIYENKNNISYEFLYRKDDKNSFCNSKRKEKKNKKQKNN